MSVDPAATRRLIESLSTHLEDHLATWKSSLVDARREIEALLTSLSDKIPAQAKPLFPEKTVALMLEDVSPSPAAAAPAAGAAAAPAQADWSVVRGSLSSIESARTQVDVLSRFLAQTQAHASRVALLVLRNDRLTGWKAVGYDATGGRDDSVRALDLGSEEDAFVSAVLKAQRSMIAEPPDESSPLRRVLAGPAPARSLLVPMVIRDRLAGLVLADELPGEDGRLNEGAIEVLTFVTGLAVDLLAARKKIRIDRDEGSRQHTFAEEILQKVGDAEGGLEHVGGVGIAEIVSEDAVADQAGNATQKDTRGHDKSESFRTGRLRSGNGGSFGHEVFRRLSSFP